MLSKSHIASGLTVGITVIGITKFNFNITEYIPAIILGSVMPDIDTSKSWVSQTIPFIDDYLRKLGLFKHRGLTHGISGIVIMCLLYFLFRNDFMLGFGIGYITHCITDILVSLVKIETNSKNDKRFYNIFWVFNIMLIIYLMYERWV